MKINFVVFLLSILLFSCQNEEKQIEPESKNEAVDSVVVEEKVPVVQANNKAEDFVFVLEEYEEIGRAIGDLNNDEIDDVVLVCNNGKQGDWGLEREVRIYKNEGNKWTLWNKSIGPVLGSEHGGMMGDPFLNVKIDEQSIVISHFGGSRDKWGYMHRYQFQNDDWYLIETEIDYGSHCEYWETYEYSLTTGNISVLKNSEQCNEDGEPLSEETMEDYSFTHELEALPRMANFPTGENEVELPDDKGSFYY